MNYLRGLVTPLILWILRTAAAEKLRQLHPVIIGIGGSSGKTSLALLLSEVLKEKYRVKVGLGKNSETGLPLDILDISQGKNSLQDWLRIFFTIPLRMVRNKTTYAIYIAEMGIDSPVEPKNMSYLLKFIHPTLAVVTNIGLEHSVYFDKYIKSVEEESRENEILTLTAGQENLLLQSLPAHGTVITNLDDTLIIPEQENIVAKKVTISLHQSTADFYSSRVVIDAQRFTLEFLHLGKTYTIQILKPLPKHFAYEFLFTIALANALGISIHSAIETIEQHATTPPGRSNIFSGIQDTILIDSTYNNATLTPMLDMLDFLQTVGRKQRKVAIIGDMRELGTMSKMIHEKVGHALVKSADMIILIGPLMKNYVAPILKQAKCQYASFVTYSEAKQYILDSIQPKDIILIKGSQNTLFLERVVEMLLLDKEDESKLCRRGEFWDNIRSKTP